MYVSLITLLQGSQGLALRALKLEASLQDMLITLSKKHVGSLPA
jgi:hypothetical protein